MNATRRKRRKRDQLRFDWIGKILLFVMLAVFIGGVCFAEQRASRRFRRATARDGMRVTPLPAASRSDSLPRQP